MLHEQLAGAVGTSDFVASGKAVGAETRHRCADRVPYDTNTTNKSSNRSRKIFTSAHMSPLLAPQVLKEARGRVSP